MKEERSTQTNGASLIAWHAQPIKDVLATLDSTRKGLSSDQAADRLKEHGPNALPQTPPKSVVRIFVSQFSNPFMAILIFAGVVSMFLGELLDLGVITAAVLINVILGFFEEYKADRSLEELKHFLPEEVRVRRDGTVVTIPSADIVEGDVLLLVTGDKVTADARMLYAQALETSEAALTGESTPVKKDLDLVDATATAGDRTNMIFAGTVVVAGHAEAVVVGTGMQTEIGRISQLVSEVKDEKTPLQNQLAAFARLLGVVVLMLAALIFLVGVLRGFNAGEMFYVAVALAVAAVPEGLIVAVTVVLAIGMQRILKKKALVRRLVAAETLGSVSVICMDKTGTLTTGVMSVEEIRIDGKVFPLESEDPQLQELRELILWANATVVQYDRTTGEERLQGAPTDAAMFRYARDFTQIDHDQEIGEVPFSSKLKFAATSFRSNGHYHISAVGAPDILLERADITDPERAHFHSLLKEMAGSGLRVILVGKVTDVPAHTELKERMVQDLEVVGFIGLKDPLRVEAPEAIALARAAGLHPVMITGDHPETARVIALETGLSVVKGGLMTGVEVDELSDDQLLHRIEDVNVFARVVPKHKLRIIRAWQRKGKSVAMTGDGVNDAPAIKAADIGIALGSGTSVAKETADMVLLDNNFATIVEAIREGRIIFDNLRKMIVYLLADSFSEIVLVLGALMLGLPLPILPAQILWINLIADGLPAVALTFEPGEDGVMNEPPRRKNEPILNREMVLLIFVIGLISDSVLFGIFWYLNGQALPLNEIRTFVYVALGSNSLFYVFAVRKFRTSIFRSNPFENRFLLASIAIGFAMLVAPLLIAPLRAAFTFTSLNLVEWGIVLALSLGQLLMIELVKELFNRKRHNGST